MRFLKSLAGTLEAICSSEAVLGSGCKAVRLYLMDESRFGLLSIQRRCLSARGTKTVVPYQHRFGNFYLFGAYAPGNGDHFTLELPYCNTDCFELWLQEFSRHKPGEFKIVILDNGAFHKVSTAVHTAQHPPAFSAVLRCGAESGGDDLGLDQEPAGQSDLPDTR